MSPYYEQDGVTIYHGDSMACLSSSGDAPTYGIPSGSVHCVVTSPPYNQMAQIPEKPSGMWAQSGGGAGFVQAWRDDGYPDDLPEEEYQKRQRQFFGGLYRRVCASTASLFYNHQIRWRNNACLHPVAWFRPHGWRLRQEIIWNRGCGMMFNAKMFVRFDERILWFVAGDEWTWNQEFVGFSTVWNIGPEQQQQGKLHPVSFPVEIPTRCILSATNPGDVVLDPFMGSGTTLVAAKRLGRKAIGIEIEEKYCEIAAKRLSQGALDLFGEQTA